jgi:hypothetical protein
VHEVPRRIDVVIIVAGVGERLAGLAREADDQSCCKKELHLFQSEIVTVDRAAAVEMRVGRGALDHIAGVHLRHRALALR